VSGKEMSEISTPLSKNILKRLRTGDRVKISGTIYTARDAAHKRMYDTIEQEVQLPFNPADQVLFYVGPTPAPPGKVIGSAGPTTAGRMDAFTPMLIERGLRAMIGKGRRSEKVRKAMIEHGCIYFGSVEGTAALLSECIRSAEIVAYEDLGPEAVYQLTVDDFPAIVVNDLHGGDLYDEGRKQYRRSWPG
jgi:fumarate hydratase subunit beta